MSQHDYNLENQAGLAFRADINDMAIAIATNNSGATEPTTTFAHQFWQDESSGLLKQRNASNTGWITLKVDGEASSMSITPSGVITATDVQQAIYDVSNSIGRKNLLINADFRVNQRGYVSGVATIAANQYTLDRWRVITSGQNISFPTLGTDNTITCPAGGLAQKIEPLNVQGGAYVISWQGTATCTVDGTARVKGESFTLTKNTLVDVKFSSGSLKEPQLEKGSVATAFDFQDIQKEVESCQRYLVVYPLNSLGGPVRAYDTTGGYSSAIFFPVPMRVMPTIKDVIINSSSDHTITTPSRSPLSVVALVKRTASDQPFTTFSLTADAEL